MRRFTAALVTILAVTACVDSATGPRIKNVSRDVGIPGGSNVTGDWHNAAVDTAVRAALALKAQGADSATIMRGAMNAINALGSPVAQNGMAAPTDANQIANRMSVQGGIVIPLEQSGDIAELTELLSNQTISAMPDSIDAFLSRATDPQAIVVANVALASWQTWTARGMVLTPDVGTMPLPIAGDVSVLSFYMDGDDNPNCGIGTGSGCTVNKRAVWIADWASAVTTYPGAAYACTLATVAYWPCVGSVRG